MQFKHHRDWELRQSAKSSTDKNINYVRKSVFLKSEEKSTG